MCNVRILAEDAFPMTEFNVSWCLKTSWPFSRSPVLQDSRHHCSGVRLLPHHVASSRIADTFTEATHTRNSSCHSLPPSITRICTSRPPSSKKPFARSTKNLDTHARKHACTYTGMDRCMHARLSHARSLSLTHIYNSHLFALI